VTKRLVFLILLPAFCIGGCDSDDGLSVDPTLASLANCTGAGFGDTAAIFNSCFDLLVAISSPQNTPPNVTYDAQTGVYSVDVDLDDNGTGDITIEGVVTSAFDLTDGIQPGESLDLPWTVTNGPLTGNGDFNINWAQLDLVQITGAGNVSSGQGCGFDVTNLDLSLNPFTIDTIPPVGSMDFDVDDALDLLSGTILMDGTQTATVNADFAGALVTFFIDLNDYQVSW
jgi:hypothetical protein